MEGPGVILALLYFPEILFAHFWDVGTPSPPALAKTFHLNGLQGGEEQATASANAAADAHAAAVPTQQQAQRRCFDYVAWP
jgi:hypothetical protein